MRFQKIGSDYVIRLERGEELITALTAFCRAQDIRFAEVSGIGATHDCDLGVFDVKEKQYYKNGFQGTYEITCLSGTITWMDEAPYLHLHMTIGDRDGQAFAGHLNRAVISATAEIILRTLPGAVGRFFDDEVGLNLLDLEEA